MPFSGDSPRQSIFVALLHALAGTRSGTAVRTHQLAKALGTSRQLVSAKLQPLVRAGLVTRRSDSNGPAYAINEEGRAYLRRRGAALNGAGRPETRR
jgi:DNA-binding transcriptional ArsR family regulator